jgi:hypothetical protein
MQGEGAGRTDASHKANTACVRGDERHALASSDTVTGKPTVDVELSTDLEGWDELPNHECVSWFQLLHIDQTVWLLTLVGNHTVFRPRKT